MNECEPLPPPAAVPPPTPTAASDVDPARVAACAGAAATSAPSQSIAWSRWRRFACFCKSNPLDDARLSPMTTADPEAVEAAAGPTGSACGAHGGCAPSLGPYYVDYHCQNARLATSQDAT